MRLPPFDHRANLDRDDLEAMRNEQREVRLITRALNERLPVTDEQRIEHLTISRELRQAYTRLSPPKQRALMKSTTDLAKLVARSANGVAGLSILQQALDRVVQGESPDSDHAVKCMLFVSKWTADWLNKAPAGMRNHLAFQLKHGPASDTWIQPVMELECGRLVPRVVTLNLDPTTSRMGYPDFLEFPRPT